MTRADTQGKLGYFADLENIVKTTFSFSRQFPPRMSQIYFPRKSLSATFSGLLELVATGQAFGRTIPQYAAKSNKKFVGKHPMHMISAWLGNSIRMASKHYLQSGLNRPKAIGGY